jgi:hypothetical protein
MEEAVDETNDSDAARAHFCVVPLCMDPLWLDGMNDLDLFDLLNLADDPPRNREGVFGPPMGHNRALQFNKGEVVHDRAVGLSNAR